jgi:predicted nucleotidyltransferase component of viral defense system
MEYGGTRLRFTAELAGATISLQVDIGFGDAVTPEAREADFPTILDHPAPHLRVYPPETVVAEKFQAMVKLGIANSRLKDFYDIWLIGRLFSFDGRVLSQALVRTFEQRSTQLPLSAPLALTEEFSRDVQKMRQWNAFLNRTALQVDTDFAGIVAFIADFIMPLLDAHRLGHDFTAMWPAGGSWQDDRL